MMKSSKPDKEMPGKNDEPEIKFHKIKIKK